MNETASELTYSNSRKPIIGFTLSLVLPSTFVIQKYMGLIGVAFYFVIASSAVLFYQKKVITKLELIITNDRFLWIAAATFIILLAVFCFGYPIANSQMLGQGSDRDEALNIATAELLKGHFPYHLKTYLGDYITPLPGSLVLAIPFVLLGNSAYQNIFWLLAFFFTMNKYFNDRRLSLLLLLEIILLSPVVLREFITGGDLLANSIFVLLFIIWTVEVIPQSRMNSFKKSLLAALLGIGLATRINFILTLPLLFAMLVKISGWKSAIKYTSITFLTFFIMIIPFYLWDPQGFSPFRTVTIFDDFHTFFPFSVLIVPFISGVIALILACRLNQTYMLRNCTVALAFPVLCAIVLRSIKIGSPDFLFAEYGISFLFFGTVAFLPMLKENNTGGTAGEKF